MATNTPKLNLVKPDLGDNVDITELNGNMDILDDAAILPVDISSPAADEFLRYDGTDWVNTAADATTSSPGVVTGTTSNPNDNTALGVGALDDNTTGDDNTAVGRGALTDNTEGNNNTAVGRQALFSNTAGNNNTASGYGALRENTDGDENTAVGYWALRDNTEGNHNTASGYRAMLNNTTANDNAAFGQEALRENTTGILNTAVGYQALRDNTTGENNIAVGWRAMLRNTTGNSNTVVGRLAAQTTQTGSNNTTLGFVANPSSSSASNEVTLGNSNITSLRCNQTSISSLSDVRDKTDIETTALGLEVINKVRPVEFTWARRDGTMGNTPDIGFVAQELAEVEDDLGETDRLRLTLRENPEKLEAAPGRLLPVLVKAVQELSAQNDELRARLDAVEGK